MNELTRESLGTVHTHIHTHTSIFIQRIFVQLQEERYITNKINEIMKRSYIIQESNKHY